MSGQASAARRWEQIARRIRVPLGFVMAAVYLVEVARRMPHPVFIAWSVALILPGLALRAAASGTVKKNRELATNGPYAYTRNPLYLGSALIAAGFALALESWPVALLLAVGFAAIYVPVIASEERFLRATFSGFEAYCRCVPRFLPRMTPQKIAPGKPAMAVSQTVTPVTGSGFSPGLYIAHREYNAAIGAALLYLSLLYLHSVVEKVFSHAG
jgi:protein-S-isoprenylcysteine O-methyltransferase Ste14